jgi:glycosyltransferase involved in cell wall biosynthesis
MLPASDPLPRPLRVLLIVESCNPQWNSVPLVGYNNARALCERPDLRVTVVTQIRNRAALEADPIAKLAPIHFIDNEWIARPLARLTTVMRGGQGLSWTIQTAMAWPAYMAFEKAIARKFSRPFSTGQFDLIHRITPLSPTMGSPLASLTSVPMIIGPLNGGLPWPKDYPELRQQEKEWLVPLRDLYRILPYYISTYRHLAAVIVGSRHNQSEIPLTFHRQRFYLPENGVDPARFPLATNWPEPNGRFRFITVGRLVPYKGYDLTLEAMAGSPALQACELSIIGDGPERQKLELLTKQYGLEANVRLLGQLAQPRIAEEFSRSQAFVFPSLREFGGGVVMEAMASGLPAIVVDYGGPGELATPKCGILLPMQPRPQLVHQLRSAMEALAGDLPRCRVLGAAACQRVRDEFTWSAKATRLVRVYQEVLAARAQG